MLCKLLVHLRHVSQNTQSTRANGLKFIASGHLRNLCSLDGQYANHAETSLTINNKENRHYRNSSGNSLNKQSTTTIYKDQHQTGNNPNAYQLVKRSTKSNIAIQQNTISNKKE